MPTNPLICLGISHKTGSIEQREQMATAVHQLTPNIPHLLISTCNRVELYTTETAVLRQRLAQWQPDYPQLAPTLYQLEGESAMRHLHRVAAGLESMVLGEAQILGQIRHALETAVTQQTINPTLKAVTQSAIRTGKRVRTETHIARYPASMSAIAIQQAHGLLGHLSNKRFLIVGVGEMGRLTVKALQARGFDPIDIANRTLPKAEALLCGNGTAYTLDALNDALKRADVVFTAVRTITPLISQSQLESILPQRNGRPLVLIDLGVPRNVETAVITLPTITLINVDGLQTSLDDALAARQAEIPAATLIINEEMAYLESALKTTAVTPTIKALRQKAETIRQKELQRTLRFLDDDIDDQTRQHIEHLSHTLVKKLLHEPTRHLRSSAQEGRADSAVTAVRKLFHLTDES